MAAGKFSIYPIDNVDQGVALLTGMPADVVNARVEERLTDYAERAHPLVHAAPEGNSRGFRGRH